MSKNEHTGDRLVSKPSSNNFRDNFDKIFGTQKSTTQSIVYWPDGTWCGLDEVHNYTHMSDDFAYLELPLDFSDGEIEHAVTAACGGR